jgi:peptide/nickel transport system permease protein
VIPVAILVALVIVAIIAPAISPYDYAEHNLIERVAPGFWNNQWYVDHPNVSFHLLGTDAYGRDIFSRVMNGARVSLVVSAVAIAAGMTIGSALGLIAGYYGGLIDEVISRFVDIWLSLPFILVALIAAIVFGTGFTIVIILMALLAWSVFVRNIRAEVLTLREREYVYIARIQGASDLRIIWRHLAPGVMNTIIVIATLRVGQLVLAEATLSYLGAGLPSPTPAWGLMVSEGRNFIATAWWIAFFPGICILLLVMSLNFIGDWSRDRFDPRLRQMT